MLSYILYTFQSFRTTPTNSKLEIILLNVLYLASNQVCSEAGSLKTTIEAPFCFGELQFFEGVAARAEININEGSSQLFMGRVMCCVPGAVS